MAQLNNTDPGEIYLYHYTSFESAMAIIKSGYFLLGPIESLNDPLEFWPGEIVLNDKKVQLSRKEFISRYARSYRVISFTSDPKNHLMWTHYANKFNGCALKFKFKRYNFSDKETIIQECKQDQMFVIDGEIEYSELQKFLDEIYTKNIANIIFKLSYFPSELNVDNTESTEIIETHNDVIDFTFNTSMIHYIAQRGKNNNFNYEKEYRLVCNINNLLNPDKIGYNLNDGKPYLIDPLKYLTGIIIGSEYDQFGQENTDSLVRNRINSRLSELSRSLPESVGSISVERLVLNPKTGKAKIIGFNPDIIIHKTIQN